MTRAWQAFSGQNVLTWLSGFYGAQAVGYAAFDHWPSAALTAVSSVACGVFSGRAAR